MKQCSYDIIVFRGGKMNNSIHKRVEKYACEDIDKIYSDFNIEKTGLNKKIVKKNREAYGKNKITNHKKDTVLFRLRRSFINPFTIMLFILASISLFTDIVLASNFTKNITTAIVILSMLLFSGIIRFIEEMRSKNITDNLTKIVVNDVIVLREGKWTKISSDRLVVGDIISLNSGDSVQADIRVVKADDLFVSQSAITGESQIFEKDEKTLNVKKRYNHSEYKNIVFMGSTIIGGNGQGIVLAVGKDTLYGEISDTQKVKKNTFEKNTNSITIELIKFMVVLIPIVFISCVITKGNLVSSFLFALSVGVGLTPEMLPMVVNACLAKGSSVMGRKKTVIKNISAMQELGAMDILCVDKTGTLTGDKVLLEYYTDILGNESKKVLDYAYLNSLYHTGVKNHLDSAILEYRNMPNKQEYFEKLAKENEKLDEIPFDYDRKFTSALVKNNDDNLLLVKGDFYQVCNRCKFVEYKEKVLPMMEDNLKSVHSIIDEMLEDGMKVIAVAYKKIENRSNITLEDENELTLLGYLAFFDAPKKSAVSAIEKMKQLNINVKVLTGDQKDVAVSICRRLGIDTTNVITGIDLENLSEDEQIMHLERTSIFCQLTPKQKKFIVKKLQENGHIVGFLGDGVNDVSAIMQADVGISVENATKAVKESADVILLKKDLNILEEGIIEGRKAFANMSKYIKITASSNFGNICSIVLASIFLPFLPMTSIQLLLLNLLYDVICLVLPWDNVDKESYSKPVEWSGKTLGRFMRFFGPISSIFDISTFLFLYFVLCPMVCGGTYSSFDSVAEQVKFIAVFQTGWFLESMWTQVLIIHLLRCKKHILTKNRASKQVLSVTLIGVILFAVLILTNLGYWFGLVALPITYFIFLIITVILYMSVITIAKVFFIKKYNELI